MGADGGAPSSAGHSGRVAGSSDLSLLPQFIPLEPISLSSQKCSPGELRRALSYHLGNVSDGQSFGASHFRLPPPAATEDLKHYRDGVLDGFRKARERSELLAESILRLDKYREVVISKKRQRSDAFTNEKLGGSNLLKMGQIPRSLHDHSTQKLENKNKSMGLNRRNRSAELKVDSKSGVISRDQASNEKGRDIPKIVSGSVVQPEERIRRLSAMGEGWDKKVKRKRSVATVANRGADSDGKQTMHFKSGSESKLPPTDPRGIRSQSIQSSSSRSPSPLVKGKSSRELRAGPFMMNPSSDIQASSDASEGSDPANKVPSLSVLQNHQQNSNSLHSMTQWVGQRPQKISRTRRANVVPPVSNYDEAEDLSPSTVTPVFGIRKTSNGNSVSLASIEADNTIQKSKVKLEPTSSPIRLPEAKHTKALDHGMKDKGQIGAVLSANGKPRGTVFPTKKNRALGDEDTGDVSLRQGKGGRALPSPKLGVLQIGEKLESVPTTRSLPSVKPVNEKNKSKSGRPPSRKLSERKAFARAAESDDDREELIAAAASARKSSFLACSGRFWKKMEPIFGSVGLRDTCFLKEQLSCAERLGESISQMCEADYDVPGVLVHNNKGDTPSTGFGAVKKSDKMSSLYQRLLSAVIEEDDSEPIYNGGEVISTSFQCASDDSHCGSCNYNDVEMRDRDRLESEAESIVDFQIHRLGAGDVFSCNRSVASNTSRNLSMSDSLYSSGRWQGDDGLSHSDVELVSGIYQNDMGGSQHVEANTFGAPLSDCQYQLMGLDERLVLELQSIGLYLDTMPDLAEGEEVVDQDLMELKEGLRQEVELQKVGISQGFSSASFEPGVSSATTSVSLGTGAVKMKANLARVDRALLHDREREKKHMERLAMNQLIQMAYRKRMACRRTNGSRNMTRKVSKQVAMGFIERTLSRCRKFEVTGWSCFSEPALQDVLFSAPASSDAKPADCLGAEMHINAGHEPPKHEAKLGGPGPVSGRLDIKVPFDSPSVGSYSFDEHSSQRGKKRELLLDDVGDDPFSRGPAPRTTILGGAKGKRSERSPHGFDGKPKAKFNRKPTDAPDVALSASSTRPSLNVTNNRVGVMSSGPSSFNQVTVEETEELIDFSKMPAPEFESLEQLGVTNDLGGAQDLTSWLDDDGLQDYDSMGLEIPMDDISNLNMLF